jgi:hypothetical protein
MNDYIHENIDKAHSACCAYSNALTELQEEYGVSEENEDSCASIYIVARYRTESGEVKEYCY